MQIHFQKLHGAGNDFIVFDNRDEAIKLSPHNIQHLCDRHFGIGADGIIEVRQSPYDECAAYMHYSNADGSLAEMCGNGVRCFARFLIENHLISEEARASRSFIVDTLAGQRPVAFELDENGEFLQATVGMGEPAFAPEMIPTEIASTKQIAVFDSRFNTERLEQAVIQAVVHVKETRFVLTCVSMGNPHAVNFLEYIDEVTAHAFVHDPQSIDLNTPGKLLESNTSLFPEKTNVEIAAVNGINRIRMRVYERGVGETLACGTGACAVAVVAVLLGKADRDKPIIIDLPGGTLVAEWLPNNQVTLTGPAKTVFAGVVEIN